MKWLHEIQLLSEQNIEVILETKEKDKGSHQFIHSEGESQIKIAEEKRQKFDGL